MEKLNLIKTEFQGLPLIKKCIDDIGLSEIFESNLPKHNGQKVNSKDCISILIANIILERMPLYKIPEWSQNFYLPSLLGHNEVVNLSDDRIGRILDQIQDLDHGSMITKVIQNAISVYEIDVKKIHNDSTSIKTHGQLKELASSKGLQFKNGHSKDHRPDLKQILLNLSITEDGMIPLQSKCYNGNVSDNKTHIETWEFLKNLVQRSDFWYIADSKVCTNEQLDYIVKNNGKVISILPRTWKEAKSFIEQLKTKGKNVKRTEIYRKPARRFEANSNEYYSLFDGEYRTDKGHYIYWFYSTTKAKCDKKSRETRIEKIESLFEGLKLKLNKYYLKEEDQIREKATNILKRYKGLDLFQLEIIKTDQEIVKNKYSSREINNSSSEKMIKSIYSVKLIKNTKEIRKEENADGAFPLIVTCGSIKPKAALIAYKNQPHLEKKFSYLKSVHDIAPIYLKSVNRIESLMLLYFFALLVQSLIERTIRTAMKKNEIDGLPIYPEERYSTAPTTNLILEHFNKVSAYKIELDGKVIHKRDKLNGIQLKILNLAGLTEDQFWGQAFLS